MPLYSIYQDEAEAQAAELLCPNNDFLRFSCSDYIIFDVAHEVFKDSGLLHDLIGLIRENRAKDGTHLNSDLIEIPFCAFDFKKFLDFSTESNPKAPSMTSEDLMCTWKISDYFDIPGVKNNVIKELENITKTDNIRTIRERLCIKNDYNEVEEKQMCLEGLDVCCPEDFLDEL